jgi:hypothetical protein
MTATKYYKVSADAENNGDLFWQKAPEWAVESFSFEPVFVPARLWRRIASLLQQVPGWEDGAEWAPHPLLVDGPKTLADWAEWGWTAPNLLAEEAVLPGAR